MLKNRRGLSDLVSNVLIILLVFASIAIMGVIILNLVKLSGDSIENAAACKQINVKPVQCIHNVTDANLLFSTEYDTGIVLKEVDTVAVFSDGTTANQSILGSVLGNFETQSVREDDGDGINKNYDKFYTITSFTDKKGIDRVCVSDKIGCTLYTPTSSSGTTGGNTNSGTGGQTGSDGGSSGGSSGGGGGLGNPTVCPASCPVNQVCSSATGNICAATVQNPISSCMTITNSGTYMLTSNVGTGSGECIFIKASNVIINGNGFTVNGDITQYNTLSGTQCQINRGLTLNDLPVTGNVNLYAHECGSFEAKGGTLSLIHSKVDEINAYGNTVNDKIMSNNVGYFAEQGTAGGNIFLLNSEANIISVYGGEAIGIAHSDYGEKGGNGGNVNAINSKINYGINAYGGIAYNRFDGAGGFHKAGNGGNVNLVNSTTPYIEVFGGEGRQNYMGFRANGGHGGSITYDCGSQTGDMYYDGGSGFINGNGGLVLSQCYTLASPALTISTVTRNSNGDYLVSFAGRDNTVTGSNADNPYNIKIMAGVPPYNGNEVYSYEEINDFTADTPNTGDFSFSIVFPNNNCPNGDSISFYSYTYNVSNHKYVSPNSPVVNMLCSTARGSAIELNQTNSISTPQINLNNLNQLTVSFWFNLKSGVLASSGVVPGVMRIIDQEWTSGAFTFHLINYTNPNTFGKVKIGAQYNLDQYIGGVGPSGEVNAGQWYYATLTVNQTTSLFYLNGIEISRSAPGTNTNQDLNKRIYLGGNIGSVTNYVNDFNGYLDELKVYNRPLTPAEILSQYNNGNGIKGSSSETGLIAAWNFDEGSGSTISSYSGSYPITGYSKARWTSGIVPTI